MRIGDTIRKDATIEEHIEFSNALNAEGFAIEDMGEYYIAVATPEPEPPTQEEIQKQLSDAVQSALDDFAKTRLYDGIMSACSYANSTDPQFAAEAEYCIHLRDTTWRTAYGILDEVKAGSREIPTAEELLAELPVSTAEWPVVSDGQAE